MANVVLSEPFYIWNRNKVNDKPYVSNWARDWFYLIKKHTPNQLVFYGIHDPVTVINREWSRSTYESQHLSEWYVRPSDRVFF